MGQNTTAKWKLLRILDDDAFLRFEKESLARKEIHTHINASRRAFLTDSDIVALLESYCSSRAQAQQKGKAKKLETNIETTLRTYQCM